jgi:two-component system NtrC family response regulator
LSLLQIFGWDRSGTLVLTTNLERKTAVLSGASDADIQVPQLAGSTLFVSTSPLGGQLIFQTADGSQTERVIRFGETTNLGDITWCVTRASAEQVTNEPASVGDYGEFLLAMNRWAAKPMKGPKYLNSSLDEFLELVTEQSGAESGMLVLAEKNGFRLVAAKGLTSFESQKLWEKMPKTLPEEILKTDARILLPENLRRSSNGDTTVFIDGVKSVAGFPVFAEGRLVAIYYLGFGNLLTELSSELQEVLESVSDLIGLIIQRAEYREQVESLRLAASASSTHASLPDGRLMVGHSSKLSEIYTLIQKFAPVDVPTLIQGETGTGKELAAKEIHRLSLRSKKPFVVLNAAALPESLIESELFGHRRGAFTGALTDRVGLVEQADGGTLFIDEIGELPSGLQAKLLRVLQEHCVTRIGEAIQRPVNFRLICATHRDLVQMTGTGEFREDLYYRIAGATIPMPALRDRRQDIMILANYFKSLFANRHNLGTKEWSLGAASLLESHPWPGNIRELENAVARAFVMAEGQIIKAADLGIAGASDQSPDLLNEQKLNDARDAWLKSYLTEALERHGGKRGETAKALGIGERTLFRYIEQLEIRA